MFFPFLFSGFHGSLGAIESLSVRTSIGASVYHRDEAMVAKSLTNGRSIMNDVDIVLLELGSGTDSRMHQDARIIK
jgi:hypothetical protein